MTRARSSTGRAGRRLAIAAQRGIALVTAIFLIVALAALGGVMVSLSGVQQTTSAVAVTAAQTLFAARGGLEWGIHRAVSNDTTVCAVAPTTTTTALSFAALSINVSVACSYTSNTGGGGTFVRTYYLTSTATYGTTDAPTYVQRAVEAVVCRSNAPASGEC